MTQHVEQRLTKVHERYDKRADALKEKLRRSLVKLRNDERKKVDSIQRGAGKLSKDGVEFIASWEGYRRCAYKPVSSETYWTVGYGHYGPDVHQGDCVTIDQALTLLREDCKEAQEAVDRLLKVRVGQAQLDVLVSFAFNVGVGNFTSSTLLKELNDGHYSKVPDELMRWVQDASGNTLAGLVNRRKAEARKWG
jgi:lysozyme